MISMKPLRIAYYCVNDPLDKRSWSGITYYLGQALGRNVGDVDFLGPVAHPRWMDKLLRATAKLHRVLFGREFYTKYSLLVSWYGARALKRRMRGKQYDVLVAPASSPACAWLRTDLPVVHLQDSTFRCYTEAYPEFRKMSRLSRLTGEWLERRSLARADFIFYTSHWASGSAIKDYGFPADRVFIRPFGANMDDTPTADMIFDKVHTPVLTMLYLAVEWERKGGAIAYDALVHLHDVMGVPCKLIICGCTPPPGFRHPAVEVIPFLNKNLQADHSTFVELLSTSHFLVLPSRADCSLIVACESNAYGMPAITAQTGGIPDLVRDGVNGYCLPYDAPGSAYATLIAEIYGTPERYHALIASSRRRYEQSLTWDRWTEDFTEMSPQFLRR